MSETTPPLLQSQLFGHNHLLSQWQDSFAHNKLHHGLILTGAKGIGKATLTFHFAKWLLAQNKNAAITAKQIEAGSHPGLKVVERLYDEKRGRYFGDITVDAVQPIFSFLRMSQIDDGYRIVVIDGADNMNRHAQNSILKLLEEPPTKTFFVLLVEQVGLMLPTIRSRCITYNLNALDERTFEQGLKSLLPDVSAKASKAYFSLTQGILGQAIEWHKQDLLDIYSKMLKATVAIYDNDQQLAMKWAELYAPAAQEALYDMIRQIMLDRFSALVESRHKQTPFKTIDPAEEQVVAAWQDQPAQNLLKSHDDLQRLFHRGEVSHLDRKLILLQALQLFSGRLSAVAPQRANR
jgi:DNA polymerase-3 subunit delta'